MRVKGRDRQPKEMPEDERLAVYTDRLLAGLPHADRPPLADTVEVLARTLRRERVPAEVRVRLHQRLAAEWEAQQRRTGLSFRLLWGARRRLAWAAAGLLLLGAVTAALLSPTTRAGLVATAVGTVGGRILLALGAAALLLLAVWLLRRR